jgi:hypothetical protein
MDRTLPAPVDRKVRRRALATIFAVLKAADLRQRLKIAREIRNAISGYWHTKRTYPRFRAFFREGVPDLGKYAAAMAALRDKAPSLVNGLFILVGLGKPDGLTGLVAVSSAVDSLNAMGRPRDKAIQELIDMLARLYEERTGEEPSVGYDDISGQPCGAFFDLVQATLTLAGENRKAPALLKAIQRNLKRLRERKSRHGQK